MATISQGMAGGTPLSSQTVCQAEFGTPIVNRRGPVPLTRAQRISANVANDVAYEVLTASAPVTGLMCLEFIAKAHRQLRERIWGATVSACNPGTPRVTFP